MHEIATCVICSTAGILILSETPVNEVNVKCLLEVYIEICSSRLTIIVSMLSTQFVHTRCMRYILEEILIFDMMGLEKVSWIVKRHQLEDGNK